MVVNAVDLGDDLDLSGAPASCPDADAAAEFRNARRSLQRDRVRPSGHRAGARAAARARPTPGTELDAAAVDQLATAFDAPVAAGHDVTSLSAAIADAEVVVCCGTGGVGKTTTAAALGLQAAALGRRAVVVTIDPAKRLADALGVPGGLGNDPVRLPIDGGPASCGR